MIENHCIFAVSVEKIRWNPEMRISIQGNGWKTDTKHNEIGGSENDQKALMQK